MAWTAAPSATGLACLSSCVDARMVRHCHSASRGLGDRAGGRERASDDCFVMMMDVDGAKTERRDDYFCVLMMGPEYCRKKKASTHGSYSWVV